jgi:hypothetical protein
MKNEEKKKKYQKTFKKLRDEKNKTKLKIFM